MDWDNRLAFERSVKEGLVANGGNGPASPTGVIESRGPRADLVIVDKDEQPLAIVEAKYYPDHDRSLHFGAVADTAAAASELSERAPRPVRPVIVTTARITDSIQRLADALGVTILTGSTALAISSAIRDLIEHLDVE